MALASFAIAADELAAGRLVVAFSTSVRTPFGYYFLCCPEVAATPRIKALREFLVEEAALAATDPEHPQAQAAERSPSAGPMK